MDGARKGGKGARFDLLKLTMSLLKGQIRCRMDVGYVWYDQCWGSYSKKVIGYLLLVTSVNCNEIMLLNELLHLKSNFTRPTYYFTFPFLNLQIHRQTS